GEGSHQVRQQRLRQRAGGHSDGAGIADGGDGDRRQEPLASTREGAAGMSRLVPPIKTAAWLFLALLFLYPMLWMALSSFKSSNAEIFGQPFSLPHQISFANYQKAVRQGNMGSCFFNSLWVTGL